MNLPTLRSVAKFVDAVVRGEVDALVLPTPRGQQVFTCSCDEEPYRILIEAMSEGALMLSTQGTILYCNSAFARMAGSSLERVIGSYLQEAVTEADAAALESLLARGAKQQARAELRLKSGGGRGLPVYFSTQPIPGHDGTRMCAVATDLTEVDVGRQAQLRLATIVESSSDAILSTTPQGVVLTWNKGAERLLGYTAEEMVGRNVLDTIAIDDCGLFLRLLEMVRAGESVGNRDIVQVRKDRTPVDVVLTLSPICEPQGSVLGACAIARDNTAHQRQQRRLQSVLESAPDAIVVVNHNSDVVLANSQAELLFGHKRDQLIGSPLQMLLPAPHHAAFMAARQASSSERVKGLRHEAIALRADGSQVPVEVSVSTVETNEGTLVCGSIRNVSERHTFQQALREKNALLQSALQAKDRFLASMSHELRTPLNAIIGFTGILLMKLAGPLTEKQTQQLELVRGSARHLLAIISDLLDLARIESGNAKLLREPVEAGAAIREALLEVTPVAEQKRLTVRVRPTAEPLVLYTDPRFLRQILTNLVSNAVKFTDVGDVECWPELRGKGEEISFVVSDTGVGIPPADLCRLFTEFGRVQSSSRGNREGTGLGLHLSQRIAALLGGRITVTSEAGRGSIFTLTLPVGCADEVRDRGGEDR